MIHLVTFSDAQMSRARALCIESALKHGVDRVAGPHYFDPGIEYRDGFTLEWLKSQPIYDQMGADWWKQKGVGYFLWKPYVIDQVMRKLPDGDVLIYADCGVEFVDNQKYIIDRMNQDVFVFGNMWEHAHWCKRDIVEAIMPGTEWEFFGKQCQASVIFSRVSEYSRGFVQKWLAWCLTKVPQDSQVGLSCGHWWKGNTWSRCPKCGDVACENPSEYLIDDSPSKNRNHPEFQENRWDQAILTTLAYREGIKLHWWPAVYNWFVSGGPVFTYEKGDYKDDYPALYHHHRLRDHEWPKDLTRGVNAK